MKALQLFLSLTLLFSCVNASFSQVDNESNFYTPPTVHAISQNLVPDYGVDNLFETDDSKSLLIMCPHMVEVKF